MLLSARYSSYVLESDLELVLMLVVLITKSERILGQLKTYTLCELIRLDSDTHSVYTAFLFKLGINYI
jgi:hypothetical protein